jgi:hypothetical protein
MVHKLNITLKYQHKINGVAGLDRKGKLIPCPPSLMVDKSIHDLMARSCIKKA